MKPDMHHMTHASHSPEIASQESELARLEMIFTNSRHAVIHGPPGVGKSRLAHVFAQRMVHLGRVGRHVRVSIRGGDGLIAMLHKFCRELFGPGSSLLSVADSTELMDRITKGDLHVVKKAIFQSASGKP